MPESISAEAKDFLTLMLQYNPDKRISAKVTSSLFLRVSSAEIWTRMVLLTSVVDPHWVQCEAGSGSSFLSHCGSGSKVPDKCRSKQIWNLIII